MIRRSAETLYVHPLPTHLAEHVGHRQLQKPHIVVKRSMKSFSGNCAKINSYYSSWNSNKNFISCFLTVFLIIPTLDVLLYFHRIDYYYDKVKKWICFEDQRNPSKREARSAGTSNKYLEVALLTDDFTAAKYGESKISTFMLTLGNIVSVLRW